MSPEDRKKSIQHRITAVGYSVNMIYRLSGYSGLSKYLAGKCWALDNKLYDVEQTLTRLEAKK